MCSYYTRRQRDIQNYGRIYTDGWTETNGRIYYTDGWMETNGRVDGNDRTVG